jgi:hypothetical protein
MGVKIQMWESVEKPVFDGVEGVAGGSERQKYRRKNNLKPNATWLLRGFPFRVLFSPSRAVIDWG